MRIGRSGNRFQDFIQFRSSTANGSIKTITAAEVPLLSAPGLFNCAVGNTVVVGVGWSIVKGATLGNIQIRFAQDGGVAVTRILGPFTTPLARWLYPNVPAAATIRNLTAFWLHVAGAGNATFQLFGTSAGSDSTIAIGDIYCGVIHLF